MTKVKIGLSEREVSEASESWINQQVNERKRDGAVCAQVTINDGSLNVRLSTPGCSGSGGGGRQPTQREREILELWDKLHLNEANWSGGNLNAFVKQVRRLL